MGKQKQKSIWKDENGNLIRGLKREEFLRTHENETDALREYYTYKSEAKEQDAAELEMKRRDALKASDEFKQRASEVGRELSEDEKLERAIKRQKDQLNKLLKKAKESGLEVK